MKNLKILVGCLFLSTQAFSSAVVQVSKSPQVEAATNKIADLKSDLVAVSEIKTMMAKFGEKGDGKASSVKKVSEASIQDPATREAFKKAKDRLAKKNLAYQTTVLTSRTKSHSLPISEKNLQLVEKQTKEALTVAEKDLEEVLAAPPSKNRQPAKNTPSKPSHSQVHPGVTISIVVLSSVALTLGGIKLYEHWKNRKSSSPTPRPETEEIETIEVEDSSDPETTQEAAPAA